MGLRCIACMSLVAVAASCSPEAKPKVSPKADEVEPAAEKTPNPTPYRPIRRRVSAEQQSLLFDTPVKTLGGEDSSLGAYRGKTLLVVNVASECGLTPQYEQLQAVQEKYEGQGFTVIGFPCNQFGGQEPGTADEILAFGKEKYQVDFPLMQKLETNGANRHPIYQALTAIEDHEDKAGDIEWNFEKFLVSADGAHVTRIRPEILPDDPSVLSLIDSELSR